MSTGGTFRNWAGGLTGGESHKGVWTSPLGYGPQIRNEGGTRPSVEGHMFYSCVRVDGVIMFMTPAKRRPLRRGLARFWGPGYFRELTGADGLGHIAPFRVI